MSRHVETDRLRYTLGMALIGYARVSTTDQNDESQHDLLTEAGCEGIFTDKASGKVARRPDWDGRLEYLRTGDTLVITRLSRIARSVPNLTDVAANSTSAESTCWYSPEHRHPHPTGCLVGERSARTRLRRGGRLATRRSGRWLRPGRSRSVPCRDCYVNDLRLRHVT
jgi:hypothetical protein